MIWSSVRRLAAFLGLTAIWLALWCAPALAHAQLVGSEPAGGATLEQAPDQVRLRFNEPVEAEFSPLEVYDSDGERVDVDDARLAPDDVRVLTVGLGELPKGTYTVVWRVTSLDGHVIDGKYDFTVTRGTGEAGTRVEPERAERGAGGSNHTLHAVVLGLAALVFLGLVLRQRQR